MTVNVDLLRRIADAIEQHPERYNQGQWLTNAAGNSDQSPDNLDAIRRGTFSCGSTGCVAGHAVALSDVDFRDYVNGKGEVRIDTAATVALGVTPWLADWLFDPCRVERAMPTVLRAIADGCEDEAELADIEYRALA